MSDRLNANSYFRSFEQMAGSQAAEAHVENEFPGYDPKEIASLPRRRFLKLMGASMAVAGVGLTGCRRWPKEHLVPSTAGLRDQMPGVPEFYATAIERNGVADGLLVTSYDGRPIKIEGNPLHPAQATFRNRDGKPILAAADLMAQASILEMYDPARSRTVVDNTTSGQPKPSTWDGFLASFGALLRSNPSGAGIAILSEYSSSLTYADARARFLQAHPQATWAEYEPLTRDNAMAAAKRAFDRTGVRPIYNLAKATTIVSLDGDLLGTHPNKTRNAHDWSQGRRSADGQQKSMNRMYIAESAMTITGSVADHRLPIKPSQLASLALALASAVGVQAVVRPQDLTEKQATWVKAAAEDLRKAGNAGLVAVGGQAPHEVQALAYAINFALGSVGTTITFHDVPPRSGHVESLRGLTGRMADGQIQGLLIIGGNPVYDAPADLEFKSRLEGVRVKAHLSLYEDETSRVCSWHLPRSHYLESWGDVRSYDGTLTVQQPLIMPLGDSKSPAELLAALSGEQVTDGQTLVRNTLSRQVPALADQAAWRSALHDGVVPNTAYAPLTLSAPKSINASPSQPAGEFEIRFLPSNQTYDGRYANNGWLLECPDPVTKLVWDNAALMNKSDADKQGIEQGDLIEIKVGSQSLQIPVYILWGQPQGVIGLQLGFGRTAAGPVGGDSLGDTPPVGFDTYRLRRSDGLFAVLTGVSFTKLG